MSSQVVIFSLDELRGGIIREILQRTRLKARLYNRATTAKMAITEYNPRVVILDIKGCMPSEISLLANSIQSLDSTQIIVLGDPSVMEAIEGPGIPPLKFLTDPLDPELIAQSVKEALSLPLEEKKQTTGENLETSLREFLKLG